MSRRTAGIVGAFLGLTALIFTGYAIGVLPMLSGHAYTFAWVVWVLMFAFVEAVAVRNDLADDTLSEHFRRWFHTDTKLGRSVWLVFSGGFVAWFIVPHILLQIA